MCTVEEDILVPLYYSIQLQMCKVSYVKIYFIYLTTLYKSRVT